MALKYRRLSMPEKIPFAVPATGPDCFNEAVSFRFYRKI